VAANAQVVTKDAKFLRRFSSALKNYTNKLSEVLGINS